MARLSGIAELDALRRQQIELAQKIKAAEAKARAKTKADQERRERLLGRILLAYLAERPDDDASRAITAILDENLTRDADRELFGLVAAPPLPPESKAKNSTPHPPAPPPVPPIGLQRHSSADAPLSSA